ncbi:MAG: hypothetical protein Q4F83_08450 [Eubacteriales bacterium]|nr:hypothetical protein [Eubacteriales bacterium]
MNKKMIAIAMTMVVASVPVGVFAEETADVTAQQLFTDAAAYAIEVPGMTGSLQFGGEGSLKISGEGSPEASFGASVSGAFDLKKAADPLKMEMSGNFKTGVLGQNINMDMEMYVVQDGDMIDSYFKGSSNGEETPWEHDRQNFDGIWEEMSVSGPEEFKEKMKELLEEAKIEIDWDITEDNDACEMTGQLSYAELLPMIEEMEDDNSMTEEEREILEDIMGCLKMNINCTFDKETHALLKAHVDFDGSDMDSFGEMISELFAQEMAESGVNSAGQTQFTVELKSCEMDLEFNYDSVPEITVPEEALQTAAFDDAD